jgi:hypothetical protein
MQEVIFAARLLGVGLDLQHLDAALGLVRMGVPIHTTQTGKQPSAAPNVVTARRAAIMSGRCSPTEAANLLRRAFLPMAAAKRLTQAIHDNTCRLYCDGEVVKPHFVVRLMVVAKFNNGRWTADIASAVGKAWGRIKNPTLYAKRDGTLSTTPPAEPPTGPIPMKVGEKEVGEKSVKEIGKENITTEPPFSWELDLDGVVALLPKQKPRQKPGRKPKSNWPELIRRELRRIGRKRAQELENSGELTSELVSFLNRKIGWAPADLRNLNAIKRDFLSGKF